MLFNSIDFVVFLPIVFILYHFGTNKNLRLQNALLVAASYVFYAWWDWRFLSLIIISSFVDFWVGMRLSKEENEAKRKHLLSVSILVNLGFLGFFKYFNFFIENFVSAFSFFGQEISVSSLQIILPVGISFYTFQTLSYSIDVYKRKLTPTADIVSFFAFVSFFPQLVAGPIERATHLLPQFYKKRIFDVEKAIDGLRQILWGLFKKIVIADNCAEFANIMFDSPNDFNGSTLVIGAIFFTFQIYCDFSGYSDIAIGTSRLFGFDLKQNFAFPYFSRDFSEFWRRWHISLSTWFRDYLYIPLGGSRGSTFTKIRNIFIIFIVSGFWHGAQWNFIFWGALNALYFLPLLLLNRNRRYLEVVAKDTVFPSAKELFSIFLTFGLTVFTWIFFRAESLSHAFEYIGLLFSTTLLAIPDVGRRNIDLLILGILILFFVVIEWIGREEKFAIEGLKRTKNLTFRWTFYFMIVIMIFVFEGRQQEFIYFQF